MAACNSLPGTGRLATLSAIIPGATLRRENDRGVGGLSDRTQTAYSVHGAPEAQPVVDGMNHQVASLTSGVFVYNQINIQEVVVETSGVGADRDTGGIRRPQGNRWQRAREGDRVRQGRQRLGVRRDDNRRSAPPVQGD